MPIYEVKNKEGKITGYRVQVNYTDSFGKKRVIVKQNESTRKKQDAKKVEASILMEINMNTGDTRNATLDDLYKFYCSVKEKEVKVSTQYSNERRYMMHISPYLGKKKVSNITPVDFQNWKNEINKHNYTNKYANHLYTLLNGILNLGVKYDYLSTNQLFKVGRFKNVSFSKKQVNFWTKEEFDKFIYEVRAYCEDLESKGNQDYRIHWAYYVMFNIMFYCGCRKGEVYPLQWKDIDFDKKILHITKGLIYKVKGAKDNYILSSPKTKSSIRDIVMPKQLIDVLNEHKERYSNVYMFNEEFFICGGIEPIRDTMLENLKNECAKRAGIKKIRIHDFRHSHASLLINNGVNISVISKRLGHSSIKETLDTYSHMYQKSEDEAVALINSLD